jgi:phosphoenolpyruvate synthase/pyruvate phosphate dikinase
MTATAAARLRGFGEAGAEGFCRWPLDQVREMGLLTVPGFVAEFGHAAPVPGRGAAHDAFADRFGGPGGVRATVRWWSSLPIHGVARLLPLLDLPAEPRPLEVKRFVERFAVDAAGLAEPLFERAEHTALVQHGRARDRDLPQAALWTLVAEAKDRYAQQTDATFPETAAEQFAVIAERLYGAAPNPDIRISCCVRCDYDSAPGLLGSVRIHSRDPRSGVPRCHARLLPNRPPLELAWGEGADADAIALPDRAAPETPPWLPDCVRRTWRVLASTTPGRIVRVDAVVIGKELLVDDYALVDEPASARVAIAAEAAQVPDVGPWRTALARVTRADLDLILTPRLDPTESPGAGLLARGTGVAVGACSGVLCTTPDAAIRHHRTGHPVIYVADSPDPQHIPGIMAADGLVFARGGVTSHVAVIARGTGRPCVMGAGTVSVEAAAARFGGRRIPEGATISIDGASGAVYVGRVTLVHPAPGAFQALRTVLDRCDAEAELAVFANADTAEDAATAFRNGAHGIGLCRLEHLLGGSPYLPSLQETLVLAVATAPLAAIRARAANAVGRWGSSGGAQAALAEATRDLDQDPSYNRYRSALANLGEGIVNELHPILRTARGRTVVVRLLDAPGSEFLSADDTGLAVRTGLPDDDYQWAVGRLTGSDPALGLRGARLCVLAPELTTAQVEAIITAAVRAADDNADESHPVRVDIMVPFVSAPDELAALRDLVERVVEDRLSADRRVTTQFGAMVETPRAALLAGELTNTADFLSIGTNDLTQFTWACSRDTAEGAFLAHGLYRDLDLAPFDRFDEAGLGTLVALAVGRARDAAPGIPIGVCGELGADPDAMAFFSQIGVNYVSCAPLRVTGGRLTAGQRTPSQPSLDRESVDRAAPKEAQRPCVS